MIGLEVLVTSVALLIAKFAGKAEAACPATGTWVENAGHCFYVTADKLTYDDAIAECATNSGSLFAPLSRQAAQNISTFISNNLASLSLTTESTLWIGVIEKENDFKYEYAANGANEGKHVKYTNWDVGQPDNVGIGKNCVGMKITNNFAWYDDICLVKKQAICEAVPTDATSAEPIWSNPCHPDDNAVYINKKCYTVIDQFMSQAGAKAACEAQGKILAEPKYGAEDSALAAAMTKPYWLGFSDEADEGQFVSLATGQEMGYQNWISLEEPNNFGGNQDCIVGEVGGGWDDIDCTNATYAIAVCQENPVSCPAEPGWKLVGGRCFYFSTSQMSFDEGVNYCRGYGAILFEPKNAKAHEVILEAAQTYSQIPYWIGISDLNTNGKFLSYSKKTEPSFTQWGSMQPDNLNNKEYCVEVSNANGDWFDVKCNFQLNVICEIISAPNPLFDTAQIQTTTMALKNYVFSKLVNSIETSKETCGVNYNSATKSYIFGIGHDGSPSSKLNLYDLETNMACTATQALPSTFEASFLDIFKGRLLACQLTGDHLCYLYSDQSGWELLKFPADSGFTTDPIVPVNMEHHGILFLQGTKGVMLSNSDGYFHKISGLPSYPGSCVTYVYPDSIAFIGGNTASTIYKIRTYSFARKELEYQYYLNGYKSGSSCINMPVGKNGHPSVLIVGGNSTDGKSLIWDRKNGIVTSDSLPAGLLSVDLSGSNLVLVSNNTVMVANAKTPYQTLYNYVADVGWVNTIVALPTAWTQYKDNGALWADNLEFQGFSNLDCF